MFFELLKVEILYRTIIKVCIKKDILENKKFLKTVLVKL
jgi:hypothetical protein